MVFGEKMKSRGNNLYGEKVLSQGQEDDLISESKNRRVWRSRTTGKLSQEKLSKSGKWELV